MFNKIKAMCPKCGNQMIFKNYLSWVIHTPFHCFGKRQITCNNCGKKSYVRGNKICVK